MLKKDEPHQIALMFFSGMSSLSQISFHAAPANSLLTAALLPQTCHKSADSCAARLSHIGMNVQTLDPRQRFPSNGGLFTLPRTANSPWTRVHLPVGDEPAV